MNLMINIIFIHILGFSWGVIMGFYTVIFGNTETLPNSLQVHFSTDKFLVNKSMLHIKTKQKHINTVLIRIYYCETTHLLPT